MRNQRFPIGDKNYSFDKNGDINLDYDITLWRTEKGSIYIHDIVAEYSTLNHSFVYASHLARKQLTDLSVSKVTHTHSNTHKIKGNVYSKHNESVALHCKQNSLSADMGITMLISYF